MHPDLTGLVLAAHRVVVETDGSDAVDPDLKGILDSMHNVVINNGGESTSLTEAVLTIAIVFMVVVVPVLLYFRHKSLQMRAASPDDQIATTELWDRARRMETRIEYLERVLDSEMPGWRNRS